MKEKISYMISIVMIVLATVYLFISKINISVAIPTLGIVILSMIILLCIYQKFIKYDTTFKFNKDINFLAFISILYFIIGIIFQKNIIITIIQICSIWLFHIGMYKHFNNERYISSLLLLITEFLFFNNYIDLTSIMVFSFSIFLVQQLDITAYYRKKNFGIVTLCELLLTYLTLNNYYFIFLYILFYIILIEKVTIKPSIKLSIVGVLLSLIMVLSSFFISIPLINIENSIINENLLSIYMIIIFVFEIFSFIPKKSVEVKKNEICEKLVLLIFLIFLIITKSINSINAFYSILLIIIFTKELEKVPRFINLKVKIKNKSGLNKDIKNIKEVTAVIPNYNYENYIEERIDSVIYQTYPIKELIVLDDVSKDNSVEVIKRKLEEINEKYPDLKTRFIPNKTNSGNVFKQWKKCFEVCNTEYLWICEADDSASPYFLQNIMKTFEKDDEVILSHSESLTMDENNNILMDNLRKWIDIFKTDKWRKSFIEDGKKFNKEYLVVNNTIANVSGVVFKKKKNIPYSKYLDTAVNYKLAGDWYFYEKILDYGKIAYCNKSLNYHRMHSSSVTLTTKREKEYEEICSIQNDIISRHKISKETKDKVTTRIDKFKFDFGIYDEELELAKIELSDIIKKKKIKDDILLSIIIPVYNTEPFLEKCLTSVLKQIPEKTEVIIINDGTPDNSETIIKKFQKEYKDIIKYHKKKNGGLSDTKNYGLKRAKGKYIGFVDSDDYIKEDMFECMLKKALLDDADMVYCDVELVYENSSNRYVCTTNFEEKDKLYRHLDSSIMPASWSKITKKELFDGLDYPKGYNNEDISVSPILIARSNKITKINIPFYNYFQRTGSIQNSGFSEKRFVAFKTANICFERAQEFDKKTQEKIKGCIYTHQLLGLLLYLIPEEKNKTKRLEYLIKFTKEINKYNDFYTNSYVIKYLKQLKKYKILEYLKDNNVKKLDFYLRIWL